jgi:glycosyltransferase involved in cell wall biosynthesis
MRRRLAYFVPDQDEATTSSLGIYHYSVRLLHTLAARPDPGFDLLVIASPENARAFTPPNRPPWLRILELPGRHATGVRRLWTDHVRGPRAVAATGAHGVFYPKGFLPLFPVRGVRAGANLHDTIVFHYAQHHPGWMPRLKLRYFMWATRHSLRRAAWITTDSAYSQSELARLVPEAAARLHTVYLGAGIPPDPSPLPLEARGGTLVLGSRLPHKATRETLLLLAAAARREGRPRRVDVTGLAAWPEEWGGAPAGVDLRFLGRLSATALASRFREARVLVLLSTIEGFGLPLVEAYASGTPVCYRDSTSLGELMDGAPGGWDGVDGDSFTRALAAAEALTPEDIHRIALRLTAKADWTRAAETMTGLFRQLLA